MPPSFDSLLENVGRIAEQFAAERVERQQRRALVQSDFDRLRDAGFLLTGIPVADGGLWEGIPQSTRPICEILRTLAHGDPSVALVAPMHPAVLSFWLGTPEAPAPFRQAWDDQKAEIFKAVHDGAWWGTITSEPGSGGDVTVTKATALRRGLEFLLSGQKQFGSGSGISSFMITTAIPEGETDPDFFYLDTRDVPWDGSAGVSLTAAWDGAGMAATQSHAMSFTNAPVKRVAWPGSLLGIIENTSGFIPCTFSAVIVGIVEAAVELARRQLAPRRQSLRPLERVEWTRAELDGWLMQQAYEGMLRAVERDRDARRVAVQGKTAIAELAESVMRRLSRVLGGGTFSRRSPFAHWYEDVRALGFLRPPWALAFDNMFDWAP